MPYPANSPAVRERTIRLFEFLKAVRSLREAPVRDFRRHADQVWWQEELPLHPGCALRDEEDETGAWLTVRQQQVPIPPVPPDDLLPWIDGAWDNPERQPGLYVERGVPVPVAFTADPERPLLWEAWFEKHWTPWAAQAAPAYRVQRLYRDLFLLRQRLQKEGDTIEFVWGHGLLSWEVVGERIWHPLLLTRVEIDFDPLSGVIRVLPGSSPTFLDVEPLDGLDVAGISAVTALASELVADPIDPWDVNTCHRLYREIVNSLSPGGSTTGNSRPPAPGAHPAMGHAPTLLVRRRRTGYLRDIQKIADAVRENYPIPATIASVVAYDQAPDADEAWEATGEELLLPLPSNVEQVEIVRRLAGNHGVTVQGPPGTGKSHTIANLVSHLLAHGKRVLVTSHAERPLQVLRERIPEEIRPLCVSLLGGDAESLKVLEQSVQTMAEKLGSLDQGQARREIERLRQDLFAARERIGTVRQRLLAISTREQEPYRLGERELLPADLAKWLRQSEVDLGFIADAISQGSELPLGPGEIARLFHLAVTLDPNDLQELRRSRPDAGLLPPGHHLRRLASRMAECGEVLSRATAILRQWEPPAGVTAVGLEELVKRVDRAREQVERLEEPWLAAIRQDAARGGMRRQQWVDLLVDVKQRSEQIVALNRQVAAHQLTLPDAVPLPELLQTLDEWKAHLAEGKGMGTLALLFKPNLKQMDAICRIDGAPVRSVAGVELLMAEARRRQEQQGLVNLWNGMVASIGGPQMNVGVGRPEVLVDEGAHEIEHALSWEFDVWHPLRGAVAGLGLPVPDRATVPALDELKQTTLGFAIYRLEQYEQELELDGLKAELADGAGAPQASVLWQQLTLALEGVDWDAWDEALDEARRLQVLEGPSLEIELLRRRLAEGAPLWAQRIITSRGNHHSCGDPARAEEGWAWRKAETWLEALLADDPNVLQGELDGLLAQERELTTNLVAAATWQAQADRVTDGQRRALIGWQQLIQRIGKGTGKYAPRLKREAQQRMQECREAVPVWIMPMQRVIENFDPLGEPFDVVIVDESSQCDTFALLAMFRARRAVIVGDDNQISPQGVGVDEGQVNRLIDQYLEEVPNRELFGPRQSLYDIATRAFPGVILLREHFRCLPEIIQFSNELMYDGRILPLREPGRDPQWRPIVARRVEGAREPGTDLNELEADALVDAVVECCQDPLYKGKSMGVISLLGEAQARLIELKLLNRLGPKEMNDRGLLCGDAYYFQGDERDVMFLSMVEAAGPHRKATLNKLSDRQRFNVAASRARDQMWLFYSIDAAALNPEDVRSRLIRYCEHPPRLAQEAGDPADLCESEFERAVFRELSERGYGVRPQVRVGHYKIDLLVEGQKRRLAVECGGERFSGPERWQAALARQQTLERKGWTFFRLRGSAFYRDREGALAPLWERLDQLGIVPQPGR